MCGIAGLLGRTHERFAATADRHLRHRGPDDCGHWADAAASLVHRRLAIVDPSAAGHQPMQSACGRYVIVLNGEIYNHRDLRRALAAEGATLRSTSDTEVVLALFIRHGQRCLSLLRGMYSLCIWDRHAQTAFLARDPLGIKPLYRWHGPAGELAFASELRALLATGLVRRTLDTAALAHYLGVGSLPADRTLVAGVTPLPPGHYGIWQGGAWKEERFWHPDFAATPGNDLAEAAARARQALQESVEAHLTSDVPVGLFLSGSLDSGAILALAARALPTICIGFAEAAYDESAMAARVAAHFGAEHHALTVSRDLARAWLPEFLAAMDQPSIDGFNTFCVAHAARERGFKAMLSGLGGDELFGGYPSYSEVPGLLESRRRLGPRAAGLAKALARRSDEGSQRMAALLSDAPSVATTYRCYRAVFTPAEIRTLMNAWGLPAEAGQGEGQTFPSAEDGRSGTAVESFPTELDQLACLKTANYLGNQLLRDGDAFGMASGVELRFPMADAALLDSLAPIPAAIRLAPGKSLLKRAVPELPEWLTKAPKRGFSFPFRQWLDESEAHGGGFFPSPSSLPAPHDVDLRPWYRRWSLMVLGDWLERHLGFALDTGSSAA